LCGGSQELLTAKNAKNIRKGREEETDEVDFFAFVADFLCAAEVKSL
jgi:hypothetical protein